MIEETISLFLDDRPKFTVNNAVNNVPIFPGDFSTLQGGDQSLSHTKFFQRNDNVTIVGVGARLPYCFSSGQDEDIPALSLFWHNEDFTSPQDLALFKLPYFGAEFPVNFFSKFHNGVPTLQRNRIGGLLLVAGSAVSMINVPAAITNGTVLRLDLWVRIRHNLPMEAV